LFWSYKKLTIPESIPPRITQLANEYATYPACNGCKPIGYHCRLKKNGRIYKEWSFDWDLRGDAFQFDKNAQVSLTTMETSSEFDKNAITTVDGTDYYIVDD
jgi:hypothetical protein